MRLPWRRAAKARLPYPDRVAAWLPEPDFELVGTEYGPLSLQEVEEHHAAWHSENPTRECAFDGQGEDQRR